MKTEVTISESQMEALEAARKINNELHDKYGWDFDKLIVAVEIVSFHFFIKIYYLDTIIAVYSSVNSAANNGRIYYEKSDKYEEFYSFIKRKFREFKQESSKIKL